MPSSLQPTEDSRKPSTLRDTTQVDFNNPLQVSYIGPSITPLTGLNAGYRLYQIDAKTFSVMGSQTYIANMSNTLSWKKPVWEFEYDTRQAYAYHNDSKTESGLDDAGKVLWPSTSPLNATFWHNVTEKMRAVSEASKSSPSLLHLYNKYESKSSSAKIRRGAGDISAEQKICFLRAGSGWLGHQCKERFGSDARGERERMFGLV